MLSYIHIETEEDRRHPDASRPLSANFVWQAFFLEYMRNFPNLYVTKGAGAFECWPPSSVSRFILYTWKRNLTLLKFMNMNMLFHERYFSSRIMCIKGFVNRLSHDFRKILIAEFRPRTAGLHQAMVSIYWVELFVLPWLWKIGV